MLINAAKMELKYPLIKLSESTVPYSLMLHCWMRSFRNHRPEYIDANLRKRVLTDGQADNEVIL